MNSKKKSRQLYEVFPYYLYEYTVYRILDNRCELLESSFIKSEKPLKTKRKIIESDEGLIDSDITLLGAPESYLLNLK